MPPKRQGPGGHDDPRTPEGDAVLTPPGLQTDDRVYELRGTVSKLEQALTHLEEKVTKQGTQLETIADTIAGFKGGLKVARWIAGIVGAGAIFLMIRLWGPLMTIVAKIAKAAVP